jgi:hypothetical protein
MARTKFVTTGIEYDVPHLWAYVIIGRMTAASVAQNLFHMALAFRSNNIVPKTPINASFRYRVFIPFSQYLSQLMVKAGPVVLIAGIISVWSAPQHRTSILVMHFGPLVFSLRSRHAPRVYLLENSLAHGLFFLFLSFFCALIKLRNFMAIDGPVNFMDTLFDHPAESFVGFDNIFITLSSTLFMLLMYKKEACTSKLALLLIFATPMVGPSVTLSFFMAREELGYCLKGLENVDAEYKRVLDGEVAAKKSHGKAKSEKINMP